MRSRARGAGLGRGPSRAYHGALVHAQPTPEITKMIPYEIYKLLHLIGFWLVAIALGGLSVFTMNGGTRQGNRARRLVAITHGVGLFLVLLGGFGALARLGLARDGLPGWIWAKLAVWIVFGALISIPYRKPELARGLWFLIPVLGAVAAYMALYKPF